MSSKGQIVLPAEFRKKDQLETGQELEIERLDQGEYRLSVVSPPSNQGLVEHLLTCPSKGWFMAIDSESTDTL